MESVIVGVVGVLQLDVLEQRLKSEYGVEVRRQALPYSEIRWIMNDPSTYDIAKLNLTSDTLRVEDMRGRKLLLFTSAWNVNWASERNADLELSEVGNFSIYGGGDGTRQTRLPCARRSSCGRKGACGRELCFACRQPLLGQSGCRE